MRVLAASCGSRVSTTRVDANNFTIGASPNEIHVSVTRTGEEPMVTVTHTGGDIDNADDNTSLPMTERMPPPAGDLHRARFVDADESHYVNVYTDIRAPGPKPFEDVHPLDAHTDDASPDTFEALMIAQATHASLVTSDDLPMPGDTRTYPIDVDSTADMDEAGSFDGMLQGAAGTFRCNNTGTACTVENTDGALTFTGEWIFTPAPMAMAMVADDDFLTFGYWTEIPAEADAPWAFTPFSSGSMPYGGAAATRVEAIEGSARYDGSAAGGYVRRQYDSNGAEVPDTAEAGAFTAAVNLMAHFGGLAVTAANQFTIRGTVSNFVNADGGSLDGWTVTMNPADFSARSELADVAIGPGADEWPATPSGPGGTFTNSFTGTTSTGTGSGNWRGMFYGPSTDDDSPKPTGVAGEFDATFSNGTVAGAYGATRPAM